MKATAIAPSNIAFIKYWGKKDEKLKLPQNGSISMNLNNLLTTTTVEFKSSLRLDKVTIDGKKEMGVGMERVVEHLNRIRNIARIKEKAKVVSKNNFPRGTGLSSSASGFAALTLAATKAAGLILSEKELSILARQGSGSACRSIPDGYVEWVDGKTNNSSYAVSLYPPTYWDILDVVLIVSRDNKTISSTKGQKLVQTSKFFPSRIAHIKEKISRLKTYLKNKDFKNFGLLIEEEALELHSIMLTSRPSLIYLLPETIQIMRLVKEWRDEGLQVYFTLNTGQNIHLILEERNKENLLLKLKDMKFVKQTIINRPSNGARLVESHLF